MQELITNFQQKHSKKVPLPKLYMDEDSSDSEGLELADGTRVGKKATGGAGGSAGGKLGKKPSTSGSGSRARGSGGGSASTGGNGGASTSGGGGVGGSGGNDPGWGRKRGCDDDDDDPNKRRKTSDPPKPPRWPMARKEPRKGQPTYGGQYISPGVRLGVVYPPIDRNLAPPLHGTSQREDPAGLPYTGLHQGSIGEDPPGEVKGQTGQATQILSWNSGVA